MSKPVYVIGHRSPDTDSICSAIAYANLKQALGENAIPARAGKLNAETKYVLNYFGVEAPVYIDDFYPRVKDIMDGQPVTVHSGQNLHELGMIMKQYEMKSVPVVRDESILAGIVSVSDLAKRYFDELEMQDLYHSGVNFAGILRVIDGELVCSDNLEKEVSGKVKIAAARTSTMRKMIKPGETVISGDRTKAHLTCIDIGVECLIITVDAEVDKQVIKAAKEKGVIIMKTPYDTYTCARLINQSIPVDLIMQSNVISFKPTELLSDIKPTLVTSHHNNYPVLENNSLIGLINRDGLLSFERQEVILVDHNENSQAVEGVEETHIIEIIDHHRLGGLQTSEPIFIRHDPVGSTATIVANMFWHRNVPISKTMAGLMFSAIISDTFMFKSPTSTQIDRETAEKLAVVAELDLNEFGMSVLEAGGNFENRTPAEIIHNDLKEFQIGDYRVAIGQISVLVAHPLISMKNDILKYMEELQVKDNYDMVLLMITEIINGSTYLLYTGGSSELIEQAFKQSSNENIIYLPRVMSRKKQIVPPLAEASRHK